MTTVGLRRCALWVGLMMMACGGPLPEEIDSPDDLSREELSIESARPGADLACPLEVVESCVPGWYTCGVRCCDDTLWDSQQLCGNCLSFAYRRCVDNGGPKRVRWSP